MRGSAVRIDGLSLAVRFLTIVPLRHAPIEPPGALGRAAWWFPVVGAALGAALAASDALLRVVFSPAVAAVLAIALWKVVTGGIHLDGLADCLDGLAGRDAEHRRAIMRDSRIGVFGAVGLILCILIGLVALAELPGRLRWRLLLLAPVLGRVAPLLLGAWFSPATPEGLGASFVRALSRWAWPVHVSCAAVLAVALFGISGIALLAAFAAAALAWSALLASRLGGITGDVLGGSVELGELAVLLTGAMLAHREVI